MSNLIKSNSTLINATETITLINTARIGNVRDIVNGAINEGKEGRNEFTSKKNAIAKYIENELGKSAKVDNFTKRALKIAKLILVDGYKIKLELLTLAQMEQLTAFSKNNVKALMTLDDEIYVDAVKELIKTAKIAKNTNIFSKALAKEL